MRQQKLLRQIRCLRGKVIDPYHLTPEKCHACADHKQQSVVYRNNFFRVGLRLLRLSGTHTLAHNGDQAQPKRHSRQILERHQICCYRIARDRCRTKRGNQTLQRNLTKLEHAIFQAARNSHRKDLFDHIRLRDQLGQPVYPDAVFRAAHQKHHDHCRKHTGEQGGNCHALHAHPKAKYTKGIAGHIDGIHGQGNLHGNLGISHGTEQGRAGIIKCQKRI